MHQLGSSFTIPCGLSLGPLSLRRNYKVKWQRYTNSSNNFQRVGQCEHNSEEDSPADECITPEYRISLLDFSLTVYNFSVSPNLVINLTEPKVVYICRVKQLFEDGRSGPDAATVVAFSYSKNSNSMCITSTNMVWIGLIFEGFTLAFAVACQNSYVVIIFSAH